MVILFAMPDLEASNESDQMVIWLTRCLHRSFHRQHLDEFGNDRHLDEFGNDRHLDEFGHDHLAYDACIISIVCNRRKPSVNRR